MFFFFVKVDIEETFIRKEVDSHEFHFKFKQHTHMLTHTQTKQNIKYYLTFIIIA